MFVDFFKQLKYKVMIYGMRLDKSYRKWEIMILNYIKTAFRNILRNKLYSLLNILGLSVGIAVFLLVYFFIQYEFNFDKHFPQGKSNLQNHNRYDLGKW